MSYWLQDWTWQVSWVRGARWRWVSLDLRDLSMLSRKLSYRNPVTLMGYTLGPAQCISCPSVGTPWQLGSRVTVIYIFLTWLLLLPLHCPHQKMQTKECTAIMTGGSLSSRWTTTILSQNFLHSFWTTQYAAQCVPSKMSGLSEMAISSSKFLLRSTAA